MSAPNFEVVTSVERSAEGVYAGDVHNGWTHGGRPNGGYLLSMIGRAAVACVQEHGGDHPHPLVTTATYLSAPDVGPFEVHVELLRVGRSASQARARLIQEDRECVESTLVIGRLDPASEPHWSDAPPPAIPPYDDCVGGFSTTLSEEGGMDDTLVRKLDPATAGFFRGQPTGHGEFRGWLEFTGGYQPDPIALLFVADGFPPAPLDLGSTGWVPTLELTVYNRAVPAPGPLLVRQRTRLVQQNFFDEVCEVWDSRGRPVCQATQLAGVRFPEPGTS